MPKVIGTRKQKALELYRRAKNGPSIFPRIGESNPNSITKEEFEKTYKIWSESWILNDLEELIPELKKLKTKRLTNSETVVS
jgi:ribosomal protein L15